MLGQKMQDACNKQVNAELYSSYLYLSMSASFEGKSLKGMANWMRIQAQEEMMHAMKIYDFILERGGQAKLDAIDAPPAEWDSPLAIFEEVVTHERKVTSLINGLVDLAIVEKDHATNAFLQWFVNEQVEEEASAEEVRDQMKMAGDKGGALFMLDKELGQRVFTPPAAAE
jgi:ferritin